MKTQKASRGVREGRPEKLLADQLREPKAYRLQKFQGLKFKTPIPNQIGLYTKIVLDAQAAKMAVRLAGSKPIDILHMIDAALPPSPKTWIEWPSWAMLEEQQAMQNEGLSMPASAHHAMVTRQAWARCGVMVETLPHGYRIALLEHSDAIDSIYEWPVQFVIAKDSTQVLTTSDVALDKNQVIMKGTVGKIENAAVIWGYGAATKGLSNLKNKGTIHVPSHMTIIMRAMAQNDMTEMKRMIIETAHEMSGIVRLTVAMLAMLHTSMEIDAPTRPKGQFMSKGGPKAFSERRVARLLVPGRVRRVEDYVRSRIKEEGDRIRKRLHKVKAHYRHSHILPLNGEGWTKCYCPGREPGKLWHKKIDEHWRGDETLGTVTRDFTLVSTLTQEKPNVLEPLHSNSTESP